MLTQGFGRIDATRRWGGLASISQPMVAELAGMPGEWDMMLTLLRLAVQAGARRLYCEPALFEQGEIANVADRPTPALIEQSSLQGIEYGGMGRRRSERKNGGYGKACEVRLDTSGGDIIKKKKNQQL